MTIGIGFYCKNGVVICADRQLTASGYHKFHEPKLTHWSFKHFNMAFTYSGEQIEGNAMTRKVREAFEPYQEPSAIAPLISDPRKESIRILEETFRSSYQNDFDDGFESLVAICFQGQSPCLFKTKNSKIVGGFAEYIGGGDSSALRYIANCLIDSHRIPTTDEALILGCYMVSVANRYVDGCSGGPDHVVLRNDDATITAGTGGPWSSNNEYRNSYCEAQMGNVMRELLFSGGTIEAFTRAANKP